MIAGLAAATVGAIFSSASPDMGVPALLSRFAQLEPAVLMASLLAVGTTGPRALDERVSELVRGLPSLRALIALDDGPGAPVSCPFRCNGSRDLLARTPAGDGRLATVPVQPSAVRAVHLGYHG